MPWSLLRIEGTAGPDRFDLIEPGPLVLGRHADCQLRLKDPKISRHHCTLTFAKGRWTIEDLGSHNGIYVNRQPVQRAPLRDGDVLYAGGVQWRVCHSPAAESQAAPLDNWVHSTAARPESTSRETPSPDLEDRQPLLGRRYLVSDLLHQGATGKFFLALDVESSQPACVKILGETITVSADLNRFARGVRAAAGLTHPNIVQILHAGRSGPQWWIAMELMDGPSARRLAAEVGIGNTLAPERVCRIARDVLAALVTIHERGLLHRNIRPDSILLNADGTAKLSNFSLARGVVAETLDQITTAGELAGDLAYMAPERADPGGAPDCRSDLYALGACLYTLLTGQPPFAGTGTVDLLMRVREEVPVAPSRLNLTVPAALEAILMKCLAKQPADRHASASQLLDDLARAGRLQGFW